MAESYIITIKFTPTSQSLKETEKKLTSTFDRVVNRFKNGFGKAWKGLKIGSGIAAMGTALAALLNPLAQLNERINTTLDKAGNIKDRAQGAGTDIKSYLALQGYAASKGINEETLQQALSRMQVLVGEAKAGNENALSNYAGETDMARVFYNVMNNIAKVQDPAQRAKLASDVFGQRAVAQLGPLVTEGFVAEDFQKLLQGVDLNKAQAAVLGLDAKGDQQAVLQFKRDVDDLIQKNKVITPETIKMQNAREKSLLDKENKQLKTYDSIATIDVCIQKMLGVLQDFVVKMEPGLVLLAGALLVISELPKTLENYWHKFVSILPKWLRGI